MAFTKNNEEAVSPVIGVILMVAVTVILTAVIAVFVFSMAGNIQKAKVVAATIQQPDSNNILVTYQGGQDASSFESGKVSIDTPVTSWVNSSGATANVLLGKDVGSWVKATSSTGAFASKDHVVVVAHFIDGSEQVILDSYI